MKRNMIVSIILCITWLFSTSAVAFANSNITEVSNKKLVEVFTFGVDYGLSEEITMERITEDNNVTVRIFDSNGNLIIQSRREGDDICVMDYSDPNNPMDITEELVKMFNISENEYDIISDSASGIKSINWGSWTTYSTQVDTDNKTLAELMSIIGLFIPFPANVLWYVATKAVETSYRYVYIQARFRTGTDSSYQYAQQEVTIWGRNTSNGSLNFICGPDTWTQKKSLNSK